MLCKIGAVAAIAAMFAFGAPAKAATYDFTFTGGAKDQGVSASGTFTTNDANNSIAFGSGIFSISPVSNQPAALFQATADTAGLSSDNLFPIDNSAGILFQGTGNTSFFANIFAPTGGAALGVGTSDAWFSAVINGAGYLVGSLGFDGVCSNCVADGTLTISAAATPLPATGGMMLLGLGVLGFMGYRRKRDGGVLAAA
jgi:PEP-CTERM motif-containing protein